MPVSWKEALLQFAIDELARPTCTHVVNYLKDGMNSAQHQVLAAAVAASVQSSNTSDITHEPANNSRRKTTSSNRFISREALELLVQDVETVLHGEMCPYITIEEGVHVVAWILCQVDESEPPIELVELSASLQYLGKIIAAIAALSSDRISWPSQSQRREVAKAFEFMYGISGAIGVLATCKFPIMLAESVQNETGLINSTEDFFDDTIGCPGINLQVVFDHCGEIRDVCVGLPGSWPPDKVLRSSSLYSRLAKCKMKDASIFQSKKYGLLAGSEYYQLPNVISPNKSQENEEDVIFNQMHEQAINTGVAALSDFTSKFPRLNRLNMNEMWNPLRREFHISDDVCHSATVVILAACVLYNSSLESYSDHDE